MKRLLMISLMALFVLGLPLTAFASRRDYIEERLDEWLEYADDEGYEVIDWDIDELDEDSVITYTIELERGSYVVLAEGGRNITDLDLRAWTEDDYDDDEDPFVEDTLDDNIPVLEFDVRSSETILIEVSVYEFERGEDEGYYCILIMEED